MTKEQPKGSKWSVVPVPCLSSVWFKLRGIRAAAPKGTKSCRTQGESVRLYVRTSPPAPSSGLLLLWGLFWPQFCQIAQIHAIWPKSKQNDPNPSILAQIQAKWPKSCQKTLILAWGPSFWPPIPRIQALTYSVPACPVHSVLLSGTLFYLRACPAGTLRKACLLNLKINFFSRVHATLQPALSVRPSVRRSVGPSVRRSVRNTLLFGVVFDHLGSSGVIFSHFFVVFGHFWLVLVIFGHFWSFYTLFT